MTKLNLAQQELICDVIEAIEKARKYKPLYEAVLKNTGDKKQAAAAVRFIASIEDKMDADKKVA